MSSGFTKKKIYFLFDSALDIINQCGVVPVTLKLGSEN